MNNNANNNNNNNNDSFVFHDDIDNYDTVNIDYEYSNNNSNQPQSSHNLNKALNSTQSSSTSNTYLSSFSSRLESERSAFTPTRLATPIKEFPNKDRESFSPGQPITPNTYANTTHSTIRKGPKGATNNTTICDSNKTTSDNINFGGAFQHHVPFPTPLYNGNSNKNNLLSSVNSSDEVIATHELNQFNRSGLSIYLCTYVSMYLCFFLSIHVSIYLSIYLSNYLSPSMYLCFYQSESPLTERRPSTSPDILGIVNELVSKQLTSTSCNSRNSNSNSCIINREININQLEVDEIRVVYTSLEGITISVSIYITIYISLIITITTLTFFSLTL
jgi:hypothetical protein